MLDTKGTARRPVEAETRDRWGIVAGLMAPAFMTGTYIAMFNVAVPVIRDDFGIQADVAAWVVTVYTLPFMMFMPLYGRLGDALGKRRLILTGTAVFLLGTIIAMLARNMAWLLVARAIQGLGTAGFVPLSLAIIAQRFPIAERGKVMGTWNTALPLSGLIGPVAGGLLIDYLGWRSIFWPTLILGLLAWVLIRSMVPALTGFARLSYLRRFDWGGVVLLSAAATTLLFYASSRPITGVPALQDWRLLIATLAFLGAFVMWEKRQAQPFIPLQIFSQASFTLASVCAAIRMFAMSGIRFLVPLYLVDVHHLSASATGLVLTAHSIPLLLLLRPGGQLADRWGSRWPVVISLTLQTLALAYLALLPAEAWVGMVVLGVLGQSLGAGISLAALHRASMAGVANEQTGMAAGLYSMIRFTGMTLGTALSGVILQHGLDLALAPIQAFQMGFWFVAGVTSLGMVAGYFLRQ